MMAGMYDDDGDKEFKLRLHEIMIKDDINGLKSRETGKHYIIHSLGIHQSSLSVRLQEKIKGSTVKILETIQSYLENFMSNKPRINAMHISELNLLKPP